MSIVGVCGGRDFTPSFGQVRIFAECMECLVPTLLVHGAAKGADSFAEKMAHVYGIPTKKFPAQWTQYGKAAGPLRNGQMAEFLRYHDATLIAMPGGVGTRDMVSKARAHGLAVWHISADGLVVKEDRYPMPHTPVFLVRTDS